MVEVFATYPLASASTETRPGYAGTRYSPLALVDAV